MANDKLVPAYVRIQYHSAKAPHVATIPIILYTGFGPSDPGSIDVWGGPPTPTVAAVEDFIDLWAAMVTSALTFDRWQLFTRASNDVDPVWIYEKAHVAVGALTPSGNIVNSVQHTMTFRSTNGSIFKLCTMDRDSDGFFGRSYVPGAEEQDMIDFITSTDSFIAARDNGRPITFLRLTVSQNDRLAREYHQQLA